MLVLFYESSIKRHLYEQLLGCQDQSWASSFKLSGRVDDYSNWYKQIPFGPTATWSSRYINPVADPWWHLMMALDGYWTNNEDWYGSMCAPDYCAKPCSHAGCWQLGAGQIFCPSLERVKVVAGSLLSSSTDGKLRRNRTLIESLFTTFAMRCLSWHMRLVWNERNFRKVSIVTNTKYSKMWDKDNYKGLQYTRSVHSGMLWNHWNTNFLRFSDKT